MQIIKEPVASEKEHVTDSRTKIYRRQLLKRLLGSLGAATLARAGVLEPAVAARRGYSGPRLSSLGIVIEILEGRGSGAIRYLVESNQLDDSYLVVQNLTAYHLKVEIVFPDSSVDQESLYPIETLYRKVGTPGPMKLRAWPTSEQPGPFIEFNFPGS